LSKTVIRDGKTIILTDEERQPCEVWSRIMGYYRPVTIDAYKTTEWNEGKVSEHKERKYFSEPKAVSAAESTEVMSLTTA